MTKPSNKDCILTSILNNHTVQLTISNSQAEENDMDLVFLILSVMQYTNDRRAEK
jgi:hypothetical protein